MWGPWTWSQMTGHAAADPPIWISFAAGGLGSVLGCAACHPFDVLKVRLQVQGEGGVLAHGAHRPAKQTMTEMALSISRSQGIVRGFSQGLSGQVCNCTRCPACGC